MSADASIEATFCFVDIAGYTALTDTHGEVAAADLVDAFDALVRAAIRETGTLQSLTGDCAFLTFDNPLDALAALADLYLRIADRKAFPVVRAGLHHGMALFRGNRHFGTSVNVAARVAAQATGGQILCTGDVAHALLDAGTAGIDVQHRGLVSLRNLAEPIDLFELVLRDCAREHAIDPVCKMQVDTRLAAGDLHFDHKTYWFCSLACVERFARQPSAYVPAAAVPGNRPIAVA
jgi:adenylate cyclase